MKIFDNKYFSNSIWLVLEKFFLMAVSFFVGVWIIRYLGKEEFGFYSYLLSLFLIFEVVSTLGQNNIVIKEIVEGRQHTNKILGTAFFFQVIGGMLSFFGLLAAFFFLEYSTEDWYKFILVFSALPVKSFRVISYYFDAKLLGKKNALIRTCVLIVVSTAKVTIILMKAPFILIYAAILLDAILYTFLYIFCLDEKGVGIRFWKVDKKLIYVFFRSGLSLMLTSVLITIYLRIDQIMITNMLGKAENGLYSAAMRISTTWYNIGWAAILSMFPLLIESKKIGEKIFEERIIYLVQFTYTFGLILGIVFYFLSNQIITLLFTDSFEGAVTPLKIHIWSSTLVFLYFVNEKWYVINQREHYFLLACIFGLFLNIALNYLTLETYGINAAGYNTLVGLFFSLIIFPCLSKKTRQISHIHLQALITLHKFSFAKILRKNKL